MVVQLKTYGLEARFWTTKAQVRDGDYGSTWLRQPSTGMIAQNGPLGPSVVHRGPEVGVNCLGPLSRPRTWNTRPLRRACRADI